MPTPSQSLPTPSDDGWNQSGPTPQQQAELFRPISPSRWQGKRPPSREWMVEGAFLKGTVAMVSGDGGIGKSLLMQQLCSAAVLGRAWLGLSTSQGGALMVACEDDHDELWRRQASIAKSLDREMDDFAEAGLMLAPRVGMDNVLVFLDRKSWSMKATALLNEIAAMVKRMQVRYLIIDTATQTFDGNQNDERAVMQYITQLRRLAIMMQGLVIITKHPSMSGRASGTGESGNVAWNNSVRARWYLRNSETLGLLFESKKSNYGRNDHRINLRFERGVFQRIDSATRDMFAEDAADQNGISTSR